MEWTKKAADTHKIINFKKIVQYVTWRPEFDTKEICTMSDTYYRSIFRCPQF